MALVNHCANKPHKHLPTFRCPKNELSASESLTHAGVAHMTTRKLAWITSLSSYRTIRRPPHICLPIVARQVLLDTPIVCWRELATTWCPVEESTPHESSL